jgi:Methyltransferase domain
MATHDGAPARHFYETIEGWFDFEDIYRQAVADAGDGARMVEIGSWLGRSTAFLAVEIRRSGKRISLSCVDTFRGTPGETIHNAVVRKHGGNVRQAFELAMQRGGVADLVEVIESESCAAAARFEDQSLDFVFIDADHSYEAVRRDIAAWAPKVKPGGVLAGHDHTEQFPGVVRAVTEAFSRYDAERSICGRSWWYRKPAMDFTVVITTAPRPIDYLQATLTDVLPGTSIVALPHQVRVCVSGDAAQTEPLAARYRSLHGVAFESALPEVWQRVQDAGPHRRCSANTWQALSQAPAGHDVLLLQDDVQLSDAWPLHLRYRLRLAVERYGNRFVLALYAAYPFSGTHLASYPAEAFYGNQALYFPYAVAQEYAARLLDHVHNWRLADDMVLKAYVSDIALPLLAALPNLAQHVGDASTGLGKFHESPTYKRSL